MTELCVVMVTCKSASDARKIGGYLVEQKLVACANIIPKIESIFFWQGKLSQEKETLLILKTRKALFSRLTKAVRKLHSSQVPEIIALPVLAGEKSYLSWVKKETQKK